MTRDAFNEIIHSYNRKFFAVAFRMLRNQQEAEDIVQDVFMKMWLMGTKLDEYVDKGALGITMTKNSCLDMLRKWKHIVDEDNGERTADPDPAPSPFDKMVISENGNVLKLIIQELPQLYRDLVQMRELNELSYEEIAEKCHINVNTLRVTLSRARKMIKEKYLEYTNERRQTDRTSGQVYKGMSSGEEEKELKEFFSGDNIFPGYEAEKEIFRHYSGSELIPVPSIGFEMRIIRAVDELEKPRIRNRSVKRYLTLFSAAATILIIIASWFFFIREKEPQDTFSDPALAYSETMKILNNVSMKLNRATEAITPVVDLANRTFTSMRTFGRSLDAFTAGLAKAGLQIPDNEEKTNHTISNNK